MTATLEFMTFAIALGGPELLIILVIALLLFGGTQLPKLARSLGQAQKEFKKGIDGEAEVESGDSQSSS
jgi:sec-independent protein translocase protein TatA